MRVRKHSAFFCLFKDSFEVRECAKWIKKILVTIIKLLWSRTEDGMLRHQTWNAIKLVSPSSRVLNNHTYSCLVTRYGPLHDAS